MKALRIPLAILLAAGSQVRAMAGSDTVSVDTALAGGGDAFDQPYTYSTTTPEDTLPVWSLELLYTGSRNPDSPLRDAWTTEATRAWHLGCWEPSASAGWSNSARGGQDSTLWHLGSGIEWELSKTWTAGAALDWSPDVHHENDASANGGIAGSRKIGEQWTVDGSLSAGWDRIDRGRLELGAAVAPDFGWTRGRLGAAWNRGILPDSGGFGPRSYSGNLGLSIQWAFVWGSWSTGPTLIADRWRTHAANRVLLWNLGWRPLNGIAFSVDLFRTSGGAVLQPMEGGTSVQQAAWTAWTRPNAYPPDAKGVRATLSVSW
jgi:hypothetical protein